MRILLIHADHFEYEVKQEAVKNPEEIEEHDKKGAADEVLVAFCTVEKEDEKAPSRVATKTAESISEVAGWIKTKKIFLYPYAHLSSSLASRDAAIPILKTLEQLLREKGFDTKRSPFGWYKSFSIKCKGHPLSELSRSILVEEAAVETVPVKTEYGIMDVEGHLHDTKDYKFGPKEEEFRALVEKEAFKKELRGGKPRFLDYCRKFGIEWESYSDTGHMRYGPEATAMFDLIAEYSWMVASSLGIPVFQVRGTNMFDLSVPAVKEHANLFGDRLYEIEVDEKSFVLRYAACHQQFSAVKDWQISYRNMPFGTFEVADSYRLEKSGELLLCFRVRKMHMPDLHIFCRDLEEAKQVSLKIHRKIYAEIGKLGRDYVSIYNTTRSFLEQHRDFFIELLKTERKPILLNFVPENLYYWVINVEYTIVDELNRPREVATFQIDMGNAKRFGITYVDERGEKRYPPIIHTALLGTIERYLFTVLDCAAKAASKGEKPDLPIWLSPVQVRLIPIQKNHLKFAKKIADKLEEACLRVDIDDRDLTIAKRIREAESKWIPYILVVGERELKTKLIPVRKRGESKMRRIGIEKLIKRILGETKGYPAKPLIIPRLVRERPEYCS